MTCTHCAKAETCAIYGGFQAAWPDCQVRQLAKAPPSVQARAFDQAERTGGPDARKAIRQRVVDEKARLKALK